MKDNDIVLSGSERFANITDGLSRDKAQEIFASAIGVFNALESSGIKDDEIEVFKVSAARIAMKLRPLVLKKGE